MYGVDLVFSVDGLELFGDAFNIWDVYRFRFSGDVVVICVAIVGLTFPTGISFFSFFQVC